MHLSRSGPCALGPLLALSPIPAPTLLQQSDTDGNTALHYASAYGNLKCIRELLETGAGAGVRNRWAWTPVSYSLTVQAEVYFKGLVGEGGKVRREGGGGVRIVEEGRRRAGSAD